MVVLCSSVWDNYLNTGTSSSSLYRLRTVEYDLQTKHNEKETVATDNVGNDRLEIGLGLDNHNPNPGPDS